MDTAAPLGGFGDDALAFYEGLEADNSKTYWNAHRDLYESAVRAPMQSLLDVLASEFGEARVFRPYRDVRFSADKSPYKTQAGAVLHHGDGVGSLYLQISAKGLMVAGGYYQMTTDQVARYRAGVDAESGAQLAEATDALTALGFTLGGEVLRRAPRGVAADHPRIDLLRHKGIAAMREHGVPEWLAGPQCAEHIAADWRAIAPLNQWLSRHVGAPEVVEGDAAPARRGRVSPLG